ncbi:hypothetical protein P4283_22905 [Bacillus thuringiensis]|nr:hypothetical protein [Bacillus thuringiensis]
MKKWYITVLIGGNTIAFKTIERDEDIIKMTIDKCAVFRNSFVVKCIPSAIDGWKPTTDSLKEIYKRSIKDDHIVLPTDSSKYANGYQLADKEVKYWDEKKM